jgi:hypothetical protein
MNLKDICEPDREHLATSIPEALCTGLYKLKRFVCDIRQKSTDKFYYIHDKGLEKFHIPAKDIISAAILRAISSLGLPIDSECVHHITTLSASITAFPTNPLCKASRVHACARKIGTNTVSFFCDKNGGVGSLCCPVVAWHALHAKLWANKDYKHSTLTTTELYAQHYSAYLKGKWNKFARYRKAGDPYSNPFIIPKFKNLEKWRPILSSFTHCLKPVHSRVCTALNLCLTIIATDSPLYANTLSTFAAALSSIAQWQNIVTENSVEEMEVTGYAGDISSMFDKLDGDVVLKALAYVLDRAAASVVRRYNLRRNIRNFVTIHLSDTTRHGIGISYYGESSVTMSFEQIVDVCTYYIKNTYFLMSGVLIQLLLGIPQGGPLSGPLSQIFTVHCEYNMHNSLYAI